MTKRLELMVRLVDGGQLYWDASVQVEQLTAAEADALSPKVLATGMTPADRKDLNETTKEKFMEAASALWDRAMQRVGR